MKLEGKTALVTGSSRGIGRSIALEFAREGADVAINFRRNASAAKATAADVRALGRRADIYQGDVSDPEAVRQMVDAIPLGRPGQPEEIGRAAVFLSSDDASFITGKILRVDGGACM